MPRHRTTVGVVLALVLVGCGTVQPLRPQDAAEVPPVLEAATAATSSATPDDAVTTTALDGNRLVGGLLDPTTLLRAGSSPSGPSSLLAVHRGQEVLVVATDGLQVAAWRVPHSGAGEPVALGPDEVAELGTPPDRGRPALLPDAAASLGRRFAPGSTGSGDGLLLVDGVEVEVRPEGLRVGDVVVALDLLPDARVAAAEGRVWVLAGTTDQYRHGALGDVVETTRVVGVDLATGAVDAELTFGRGEVVEGLSPLLADVDGDGRREVLVTVSREVDGARLVALRPDGSRAEGPAVGRGNRWRHLVGVDRGRLVEVVTPHLTQVAQTLRLDDGALLVLSSTEETVASHEVYSRDLERAVLVDVTGDGAADLVGPARGDAALLRVVGADGTVVGDVALPGPQTSNVVGWEVDGRARIALVAGDELVLLG